MWMVGGWERGKEHLKEKDRESGRQAVAKILGDENKESIGTVCRVIGEVLCVRWP